MPRPAKGKVIEHERADGLTSYWLRFTAYGQRHRIPLGTNADGWSHRRAQLELETTMALIRVGKWEPPEVGPPRDEDPTFHVFASELLAARKPELRTSTYRDYRWRLVCHLLPFFAEYRVSAIDVRAVDEYRAAKVAEAERIREALGAGVVLRDADGRKLRPLSNESINKTLALLASLLEVAVDYGLLDKNPARGPRRRLKASRPRRPFLERDELSDLVAAAEALDRRGSTPSPRALEALRLRVEEKLSYPAIAARIGVALSTAHYLVRRAQVESPEPILHRRAVIVVLAGTGLRNQELCDLDWRRVDLVKGRIDIPDAKTDAGIREVRLTRRVVAELRSYRASLGSPRAGYVFATATGNKRDRKNVCDAIVKRAAACADETRQDRGLMPLPAGVTPHALRCTYIAFALEAGYPLKYVMEQVGHEDESTTMRIYARVLKRQSRNDLDERFDGLIAA